MFDKLIKSLSKFADEAKNFVSDAKNTAAKNREILIRGSVLDPDNHPSAVKVHAKTASNKNTKPSNKKSAP